MIGDIHGCYEEYCSLEQKIKNYAKKQKQSYLIVSVGDLVDRGPNSKNVVEHFLMGEKLGTHKVVMGNHEICFLNYLQLKHSSWLKRNKIKIPSYILSPSEDYRLSRWSKGLKENEYQLLSRVLWLSQGGIETLQSYGLDPKKKSLRGLSVAHIKYLCSLPVIYENKKIIVTHALPVKKHLNIVRAEYKLKGHLTGKSKLSCDSLYWNRSFDGVRKIGKKVLISGHTPYKSVKKNIELNTVQLDTKCFAGGKLSAYCPEDNKIISVKALRKYY